MVQSGEKFDFVPEATEGFEDVVRPTASQFKDPPFGGTYNWAAMPYAYDIGFSMNISGTPRSHDNSYGELFLLTMCRVRALPPLSPPSPPSSPPPPGFRIFATFTFSNEISLVTDEMRANFVSALAKFVGAELQDVVIESESGGSTIFEVTIFKPHGSLGDPVKLLSAATPAELDATFGATGLVVLSVSSIVAPPSPSPPPLPPAVEPAAVVTSDTALNWPLIGGLGGGGAGAIAAVLALLVFMRRRRWRAEAENRLVETSLAANDAFAFPLHVIRANDFLEMGQLVVFEDARSLSKHEVIDLVSDAKNIFNEKLGSKPKHLVFLSHQWLAFGAPGASFSHQPTQPPPVQRASTRTLRGATHQPTQPPSNGRARARYAGRRLVPRG